jgi:hypothetical protein
MLPAPPETPDGFDTGRLVLSGLCIGFCVSMAFSKRKRFFEKLLLALLIGSSLTMLSKSRLRDPVWVWPVDALHERSRCVSDHTVSGVTSYCEHYLHFNGIRKKFSSTTESVGETVPVYQIFHQNQDHTLRVGGNVPLAFGHGLIVFFVTAFLLLFS